MPAEISSLEFVRDLVTSVPTSANVKYYANIVKEKAVLRKLIKTTQSIEDECYLGKESVEDILADTEKSIFNLVQNRGGGDYVPIKQVVINALDKIEKASKQRLRNRNCYRLRGSGLSDGRSAAFRFDSDCSPSFHG